MQDENENENSSLSFVLNIGSKYGAIRKNEAASPKSVIYCVHGNPSAGCCKVLEQELPDAPEEVVINSPIRENQIAAELINRHCHSENVEEVDRKARRKLIIASILCVIFMIGEILGGYFSNSLAIASDAAHLLTDVASFMISLFSIWMATRPSTQKMHFGFYRAEVIGALTSVLLIWVVTGILVYLAIERVISRSYDIEAKIMLITSGAGLVINLIMGLSLHQHGHTHGGTTKKHSHENINVRAAFIHVIGDFLQSLGVFIAAAVIYFKPEWSIVDPICTFLFSILVMFTTFTIIKDTLRVLMEGAPKGIEFNEVLTTLLSINGVRKVHNLRIWALSLERIAMSAHVAISAGMNPQIVLMSATKNIHDKYNFFEMTLQIEEFQDVMEDCTRCKNPV